MPHQSADWLAMTGYLRVRSKRADRGARPYAWHGGAMQGEYGLPNRCAHRFAMTGYFGGAVQTGRRGRRPLRMTCGCDAYGTMWVSSPTESTGCLQRVVGEIAEAPPVADEARRFRESAPIGGCDSRRESDGTTVGNRRPLRGNNKRLFFCEEEPFGDLFFYLLLPSSTSWRLMLSRYSFTTRSRPVQTGSVSHSWQRGQALGDCSRQATGDKPPSAARRISPTV